MGNVLYGRKSCITSHSARVSISLAFCTSPLFLYFLHFIGRILAYLALCKGFGQQDREGSPSCGNLSDPFGIFIIWDRRAFGYIIGFLVHNLERNCFGLLVGCLALVPSYCSFSIYRNFIIVVITRFLKLEGLLDTCMHRGLDLLISIAQQSTFIASSSDRKSCM